MACALFFLALLTYCSGASSQPTVTQPASLSASLGQTVKLSCTRSGGGSWDSDYSWYQQKPGQAPRFVFYGSSRRGEGIPARFSGSASGDNAYLTITNIQADDEADYYCCDRAATVTQDLPPPTALMTKCQLRLRHINCARELTMAWPLLFLTLLNYCSGVHSQANVTQPASQYVSLGQTVKLSFMKSSGGTLGNFYWYQQRPGQAPCYVHCNGCSSRGEGIPDRFTGSASGDNGYLTITNIQAEDEADYYCALRYSTGSVFHGVITQAEDEADYYCLVYHRTSSMSHSDTVE
ncbi:uncharacterized protein LOC128338043 [Hemicordylus capensis]|uniref:uncharacterized protein LOC128338043 n=1 Tax=Hemicordylus capensis TaxID=884348 RepID=UPI002303E13A|nr:uncharacterized protein LOC128338043 [Hemicordylus capensis]